MRSVGHRPRLLVLGMSMLGLGASPSPRPAFERAVIVPQPGKVFFVLDRDVYEGARADLADLRVLDETGAQSPPQIGRVMAAVMPKVAGRADGRRVKELVRRRLQEQPWLQEQP